MKINKKIAVVGASGFVGSTLMKRLSGHFETLALTRTKPSHFPQDSEWRPLDLFSVRSTFEALKNTDTAIYLVHSMMPSSRLFQGDFHDTDLLLADNFIRACKANKVRRIIYLGGLMPEGYVSPHLESRIEVEEVFKTSGIPVTILRAGMIVGPGGSSFEILKTLVQRLPFMILPAWTKNKTQAVFIDDIVEVIFNALSDDAFVGITFDVVNGESLTYEALLQKMAKVLKVKIPMIPVPIRSTGFSKLWVQIFGNSTHELVSPLIDSLLCDLPQVKPLPLIESLIRYRTFEAMAQESILRDGAKKSNKPRRKISNEKSVRSIQRLTGVPHQNAKWIVEEYINWLPTYFHSLIKVIRSEDRSTVRFFFLGVGKPLLVLKYIDGEFEEDRQKFYIIGGLLTKTTNTGWLEFRQVCDKKYTVAAIHEFVPSLPWPIYRLTQAIIHRWTMLAFDLHLKTHIL